MTDILILTEGGKNIGFGHITRCTSIYQAFEEVGIQPELIVNGDETVYDFVKDMNCRIFDWLSDRESLFALVKDADIVFVDSYLADYDLYEKISSIAKTGVYFDDDIRIKYPKGFVVNGAILADQMSYPKIKGVTYLLGAQYAPLRKEFWRVSAKPIRDVLETAMITFGGADIRNLTPKVLKLLTDAYPKILKKVIIGKGFQNIEEIEELRNNSTELVYFLSAVDMKNVMVESDIAITASGQTVYELARVGTPAIGICVAENQLSSIKCWSERGFLEYVGWYNCGELAENLKSSLEYLADKSIRIDMSEAGRRSIDGQGCKRIVNTVKLSKQVRGAVPN